MASSSSAVTAVPPLSPARPLAEMITAARRNLPIAVLLASIYVGFFVHAFRVGSKAVWDAPISIFLVVLMLLVSSWARLRPLHVALLNVPLLAHNAGLVGDASLYGSRVGPLPYDKLVHLLATAVLGLLAVRALQARIAATRATIVVLAFSLVMLLGLLVELCEYLGYFYLPQSSGFFNPSAGPSLMQGIEMYKDTMNDLLTNGAGAAVGITGYLLAETIRRSSARRPDRARRPDERAPR